MPTDTKVTHTPGPWTAGDADETQHDYPKRARSWHVEIWGFDEASAPAVATISSGRDDGANGRIARAKANAALITAAPDLLAALKAMVASYDGLRDQVMGEVVRAKLAAADAAIAKAEGQQ